MTTKFIKSALGLLWGVIITILFLPIIVWGQVVIAPGVNQTGGGSPPASGDDFLIATGTSSFDCNANGVGPGDTVTLDGTSRGPITITDCTGTSDDNITIRNDTTESGPLVINTSGTSFQFTCTDCEYVTIDGTGKWSGAPAGTCGITISGGVWTKSNTTCGIQVVYDSDNPSHYFRMDGSSRNWTIKGILCDGTGQPSGTNICISGNDHVDRTYSWKENLTVENSYMTAMGGEGIYIGPNWFRVTEGAARVRNVTIQNNWIVDMGNNTVNLKAATEGTNVIRYNWLEDGGNTEPSNNVGLVNSQADIYSNYIFTAVGVDKDCVNASAPDFTAVGNDLTFNIYNNVIYDCTGRRGISLLESSGTYDIIATVYNNTIVNTTDDCIQAAGSASGTIRDNICAGTGGIDNTSLTETNNIEDTIASQNFTNEASDDWTLTASSPAFDNGTAGAPADDILGTSRPQNGTDDQGAYERVP